MAEAEASLLSVGMEAEVGLAADAVVVMVVEEAAEVVEDARDCVSQGDMNYVAIGSLEYGFADGIYDTQDTHSLC